MCIPENWTDFAHSSDHTLVTYKELFPHLCSSGLTTLKGPNVLQPSSAAVCKEAEKGTICCCRYRSQHMPTICGNDQLNIEYKYIQIKIFLRDVSVVCSTVSEENNFSSFEPKQWYVCCLLNIRPGIYILPTVTIRIFVSFSSAERRRYNCYQHKVGAPSCKRKNIEALGWYRVNQFDKTAVPCGYDSRGPARPSHITKK